MEHTKDTDCTINPSTDCCVECGVYHGSPCGICGGRGFHEPECYEADDAPVLEPDYDDTVHCCPDCERPNQFGELCFSCQRGQDAEYYATQA